MMLHQKGKKVVYTSYTPSDFSNIAKIGLDTLIPEAHAARKPRKTNKKGKRVNVKDLAELLKFMRQLSRSPALRRKLVDGVDAVTNALKKTDIAALRRTGFNRDTLLAGTTAGK